MISNGEGAGGGYYMRSDDLAVYDRLSPSARELLANCIINMSAENVRNAFRRYDPEEISNDMLMSRLYDHMRGECRRTYGNDHPFMRQENDAKACSENYLRYRRDLQDSRNNRKARRIARLSRGLQIGRGRVAGVASAKEVVSQGVWLPVQGKAGDYATAHPDNGGGQAAHRNS